MVVNPQPIQNVTRADIGRPVSMQIAGMKQPKRGHIFAMANLPGSVFVKFGCAKRGELVSLYDLQWDHVDSWVVDRS